jgi:hypothetical protein
MMVSRNATGTSRKKNAPTIVSAHAEVVSPTSLARLTTPGLLGS